MASSPLPTEITEKGVESTSVVATARKVSSINKRKYEDAITLLDDAAGTLTPTLPERPPPPKKARTSLYSTLAKYGIGTSVNSTSSSSLSNLQRVLNRVKSAKGAGSSTLEQEEEAKYPNYDPSSRSDFMTRLQTFKLITYSSKPPEIDAVAAAKCGWFNEGKETLTCRTCKATWTLPPRQTTNKAELDKLITEQKSMLIDQHKNACPWKVRQSEASIYSMPIPSPSVLCGTILQRAGRLQPLLQSVSIKHPLSTQQVNTLVSAINAAHALAMKKALAGSDASLNASAFPEETSIIVGFFGWDISSAKQHSTSSISSPSRASLSLAPSGVTTPSTPSSSKTILTCHLCQRQIGLWSFSAGRSDEFGTPKSGSGSPAPSPRKSQPSRQFDVMKEHRPHCPYIMKSTFLPTMSLPTKEPQSTDGVPGLSASPNFLQPIPFVEGWKALMSVISRSQWRKAASSLPVLTPSSEAEVSFTASDNPTEVGQIDQVSEIVKDVKSRHGGGRDLVRFIKGLLR